MTKHITSLKQDTNKMETNKLNKETREMLKLIKQINNNLNGINLSFQINSTKINNKLKK